MMDIKNSDSYQNVVTCIQKFENEQLRTLLLNYYLKVCRKKFKNIERCGRIERFSSRFCECLNEINIPEIEYYIEYCLLFYEDDFYKFIHDVYLICLEFNFVLKDMCSCYYRYSVRQDIEEIFNEMDLVRPKYKKLELQQLLEYIIELEKKNFINCYELAKNEKTYCDCCISYCLQKKK